MFKNATSQFKSKYPGSISTGQKTKKHTKYELDTDYTSLCPKNILERLTYTVLIESTEQASSSKLIVCSIFSLSAYKSFNPGGNGMSLGYHLLLVL